MESVIDEWTSRKCRISFTPCAVYEHEPVRKRRPLRHASNLHQYSKTLLLSFIINLIASGHCVSLTDSIADVVSVSTPGVQVIRSSHEIGDTLLLQRLIKVISKNRAAMNAATRSGDHMALTVPPAERDAQNSNASRDDVKQIQQMVIKKYQELDSIVKKATTETSPQANTIDARSILVSHTNTTCPYDDVYMMEADQCTAWKAFIFQYIFPMVLILAILGNALTLAVYRSRYLKTAATVLLLAVKAQANLAFVCCLSVEMLYYFVGDESTFQDVYWRSRPYTLFLANYFDSLAVWCTLVIIVETYICISFPLSFRRWSKRRTIYIVIVCLMLASGLLHVAYPITRDVERLPSCPAPHKYRMVIRDGWFYRDYERVYFFLHALAVISLPVVLMAIFSAMVGYYFNKKQLGHRFSERRRCVLRITIATTLCTLALQTPGLIVFTAAAVRGSTLEQNSSLCTVNVITNFLAILNAAAPFLVYLCLNETFRRLLCVQLGTNCVDWPCGRLCRPYYDDHLRRVAINEATEPEHSHCALTHLSNHVLSSAPLRNNSLLFSNEPSPDCEHDHNRLVPRSARLSGTLVSGDVRPKRNATAVLQDGGDSVRPKETVRIIVEEAI